MHRPRRLRRNTPARRDAGVRLVSTLTVGLTALGAARRAAADAEGDAGAVGAAPVGTGAGVPAA